MWTEQLNIELLAIYIHLPCVKTYANTENTYSALAKLSFCLGLASESTN